MDKGFEWRFDVEWNEVFFLAWSSRSEKEEVGDKEVLKEDEINPMSHWKVLGSFSRRHLIENGLQTYLFLEESSFFDAKVSTVPDKRIGEKFQEHGNYEKAR